MRYYYGEDLRDVLLEKFLKHDLIDKSWCSLTRYIENYSLKDTMKIAIQIDWNQSTIFCDCMDAVGEKKKWKNKHIKQI